MLPKINQLVNISIGNQGDLTYKARIADITESDISVEIPLDEKTGEFKFLDEGTQLNINYLSNEQGQYNFETKIMGYVRDPIILLKLSIPQKINRIQRRDYLRVNISLETAFRIKDSTIKKWHHTRTIDISGGGFQFIQTDRIKPEQIIEGWLILPFKNGTIEHIKYEGEILRVYPSEQNNNVNYVTVKFISINENIRGKIVRFCYEKQMETRMNNSEEWGIF